MLNPGTFLNGRYEVVQKIGTGGMADVFRGKDHKLKRFVAIKVLKLEFSQDTGFLKKFQTEAEAAAGMLHPNVVNVYDVGEDGGYNYMVMELVNGITLKEYIQKKGRLSDKEVISIAIQMAAGLDAAHSKELVHRDVKPQNVMISTEGKVKVTDFGIAKPTSSDTVNANAMGSVHYTSPEQARGGACDIHSDIYSTGITIYEMITGVVPFDGENTVTIALKHIQEDILPASEYVPDIFYSLERIIIKCTQKSPSRRYDNMKALIMDLKRALTDPDGDFVDIGPTMYNIDPTNFQDDRLGDTDALNITSFDEEYDDYEEDFEEEFEGYHDDSDDRVRKITKILTIIVAVIVAFTVLFIAGRTIGFFRFGNGTIIESEDEMITVPNLEGMLEGEAKELLEELGLGYNVRIYEESTIYEQNYITAQSVEAGSEVEVNTIVKVTISAGLTDVITTVPQVVGETESSAQKILSAAKLKMEVETQYSSSVEAGAVISAKPSAGEEVAEDSTVNVVVSLGTEKVAVPNIVGETSEKANTILGEAGLGNNLTEEYSDTVSEGNVISQEISAGTQVEIGSVVNYVISKGVEIVNVTMPNVIGMNVDQAAALLEGSEYEFVVTITETNNGSVSFGSVISSNISAGASVPKETKVTLVVSIGAEEIPEENLEESSGEGSEEIPEQNLDEESEESQVE